MTATGEPGIGALRGCLIGSLAGVIPLCIDLDSLGRRETTTNDKRPPGESATSRGPHERQA